MKCPTNIPQCAYKNCYFFKFFFLYFCILLPLPTLIGQPTVAMPTLLAPHEGTDMFACRLRDAGFEPRTAQCQSGALPNEPPLPII